MISRLFLFNVITMIMIGNGIFAFQFKKGVMNAQDLSKVIEENIENGKKEGEWRYSFFKDLKDTENTKKNIYQQLLALESFEDLAQWQMSGKISKDLLSKLFNIWKMISQYNDHIYYTIKEVRQSYLPKDKTPNPDKDPQGANSYYKSHRESVKPDEIKKLMALLEKEYTPIIDALNKIRAECTSHENSKMVFNYYEKISDHLFSNWSYLKNEYNKLHDIVNEKVDQKNSSQQNILGDNDLAQQWPKILIELEPAVIKDNKELTPQFKKIKEAATQLVYFTANKGKLGYNANEKRKGLESILSELKIMQKTNFEKKYILQKRKAIGKKIDDLLLKIIKDIEISIR